MLKQHDCCQFVIIIAAALYTFILFCFLFIYLYYIFNVFYFLCDCYVVHSVRGCIDLGTIVSLSNEP